MAKKSKRLSAKRVIALITAFLFVLSGMPLSSISAQAAVKKPTIAKNATLKVGTSKTIKISKGSYKIVSVKVSSSKKSVATVKASGKAAIKVTGKKAGKATITTRVKAKKGKTSKTFKLTTKVTVKKATKPEPTVDTSKTVNTQDELVAALADSSITQITIGQDATSITIPAGDYSKVDLIVDAPNASITNNGVFKSITIKAIAANTWIEKAKGNRITSDNEGSAHIVLGAGASVAAILVSSDSVGGITIEVTGGSVANLTITGTEKVNLVLSGAASVGTVTVEAASKVDIAATGSSTIEKVEVTEKAAGTATDKTVVNVKAEGSAEIKEITTSAANSTTNVTANGSADVAKVAVNGSANASIGGTSNKVTEVDIKGASKDAVVTVTTTTVKIEAAAGTDNEKIINNQSGKALTTEVTQSDGTKKETTTATDTTTPSSGGESTGGGSTGGGSGSPAVSVASVTISGQAKVGDTISATLQGTNVSSIAASALTWKWSRCTTSDGTFADIEGATSSSYLVTESDKTNYLKVTVTYNGTPYSDTTTKAVPNEILTVGQVAPTAVNATGNAVIAQAWQDLGGTASGNMTANTNDYHIGVWYAALTGLDSSKTYYLVREYQDASGATLAADWGAYSSVTEKFAFSSWGMNLQDTSYHQKELKDTIKEISANVAKVKFTLTETAPTGGSGTLTTAMAFGWPSSIPQGTNLATSTYEVYPSVTISDAIASETVTRSGASVDYSTEVSTTPAFTSGTTNTMESVDAIAASFTLSAPSAANGDVWKVYDSVGATSVASGVTASVSSNTLTLTFTSVPTEQKTYYVTVTQEGKAESARSAALTVKPFAYNALQAKLTAASAAEDKSVTMTESVTVPNGMTLTVADGVILNAGSYTISGDGTLALASGSTFNGADPTCMVTTTGVINTNSGKVLLESVASSGVTKVTLTGNVGALEKTIEASHDITVDCGEYTITSGGHMKNASNAERYRGVNVTAGTFTITGTTGGMTYVNPNANTDQSIWMFRADKTGETDAKIVISGGVYSISGSIDKKNGTYAVASNNGKIEINGGTFTGGQETAVQVDGSNTGNDKVVINGGDFSLAKGECKGNKGEANMTAATKDNLYQWMIMYRAADGNTESNAPTINAGTFHFFNPEGSNGYGRDNDFVPDTSTCVENEGVFTVTRN